MDLGDDGGTCTWLYFKRKSLATFREGVLNPEHSVALMARAIFLVSFSEF